MIERERGGRGEELACSGDIGLQLFLVSLLTDVFSPKKQLFL